MTFNHNNDPLAGLTPLTETLDAMYKLRLQGSDTLLGVLNEIKAEQAHDQKITDAAKALQDLKAQAEAVQGEMDKLSTNKSNRSWMGFGGLKGEAARAFAENNEKLEKASAMAQAAAKELDELKDPGKAPPTQYGSLAKEKQKLRELLDLTPEEHRKRQQDIVAAAHDFIHETDPVASKVMADLGGLTLSEEEEKRRKIENAAWQQQGCPTTASVTVMRPLKLRHVAGFSRMEM